MMMNNKKGFNKLAGVLRCDQSNNDHEEDDVSVHVWYIFIVLMILRSDWMVSVFSGVHVRAFMFDLNALLTVIRS